MRYVTDVDRLAARHRPDGQPVMHQNWGKLLFMHWRINKELLRPHIPAELQIDTFGDSAWIAVTPFTMWDVRAFPPFIPPLPGLSSMHELNVRTYVHHDGVPGVWFFSLDTDNPAAVLAARTFFHLPYYTAEIELEEVGNQINYQLSRDDETSAEFQASWTIGKKLPPSQPGTREFFLTERYILYTENDGELYRARIHHQPWLLQKAELVEFDTDIFEANGLPTPKSQPLLHYAEEVNVDIWLLESVD
ncbi:MAG: YqjF family protein [Pyrinomonadaceae bacterium]